MMTDYGISGTNLMLIAAIGLGLFILFIIGGRLYLNRQTDKHLAEKANHPKLVSKALRKYQDVDVFRFRSIFLYLGLIGVLAVAISAFNWTDYNDGGVAKAVTYDLDFDIEMEPPPATTEAPPPPPPPPPTVIEEIPKDIIMEEEEIEFVDQSIDANASIDAPVFEETVEAAPPPPPPPPPPREPEVEEIFKIVEEMPRFPGCETVSTNKDEKKACADRKLMEFLYSELRYPGIARENNIEGMVVIGFVINTDGSITDAQILRDIGGGCGEEALRVVKKMNNMDSKWIPGRQRGFPVRVQFTLPVRFKLANDRAQL